MVLAGERILCVVAHADDEVLGCGATVARVAEAGAEVRVLLPVKEGSGRGIINADAKARNFAKSVRLLGAHPVIPEDAITEVEAEFSTMALHAVIEPWIEWCDVVLTHWHEDVHQTHRAIARVVEIATRPFRRHRHVIQFEVPTSTDQGYRNTFLPNLFVRVEERHVARKAAAMAVYTTEQCAGRSAESVRRRALLIGERYGVDFAEAFAVARTFA